MIELSPIASWHRDLGLLPVPLFDSPPTDQRFVLLNGTDGNFCLDASLDKIGEHTRNLAWSANVGHYVALGPEFVEVQRWDRHRATVERYSRKSVQDQLEKFHAYLEQDRPRPELSVVAHVIHVFRSLRAVLGQESSGFDSLRAFLYLLACATEETRRGSISAAKWRLPAAAAQRAGLISDDKWEMLIEELRRGRPLEQLVPRLDLVLRHAAGHLFQEAHYEALFVAQHQLTLGGFLPKPVRVQPKDVVVGLHFTPTALVRTLVEESISLLDHSSPTITVFDPACGSGEFLREALRQLKLAGEQRPIRIIGWDVSQAACDMANFVMAWETRNMPVPPDIDIRRVDSLAEDQVWPSGVDIILMNPPFVSWQDMTPGQRAEVTRALGKQQEFRPDLSSVFVFKAAASLRVGGVIGTVIPASFLDSTSARELRASLAADLAPRLIGRLGSHVLFPGALVDAACYMAVKGGDPAEAPIAFWAEPRDRATTSGMRALRRLRYLGQPSDYPIGEGFSIYRSPGLGQGRESWAPRPYRSWRLVQNLSALPTVGQLFHVRQGALTGSNSAFLLTHEEWESLPSPEHPYFRPAVDSNSIHNGMLEDSAYVFCPYGRYAIEHEDQLTTMLPTYYRQWLEPQRASLLSRYDANQKRWWELSRGRTWQQAPCRKLVSTYFGRAGSFALDDRGDYVVVQGYAWIPKHNFAPTVQERLVQFAYLALLNCSLFDELLAATSVQVSGGQWNLSKRYVDPIPIPDFFTNRQTAGILDSLATQGARLHTGLAVDDEHVRELLAPLYGLDQVR